MYEFKKKLFERRQKGKEVKGEEYKIRDRGSVCAKPFELIIERLNSEYRESVPQNSERWKEITQNSDPLNHLKNKGINSKGRIVSNTDEHFKSQSVDLVISYQPAQMKISGRRNEVTLARAGLFRAGQRLQTFERDEETIAKIEAIKQAHIKSIYQISKVI